MGKYVFTLYHNIKNSKDSLRKNSYNRHWNRTCLLSKIIDVQYTHKKKITLINKKNINYIA